VREKVCRRQILRSLSPRSSVGARNECRLLVISESASVAQSIKYAVISKHILYRIQAGNFFFSSEGPRSRRYGRTAAMRLLVQPYDDDDGDDDDFCPFPSNGAPVELN
jgi:hypothetical protein